MEQHHSDWDNERSSGLDKILTKNIDGHLFVGLSIVVKCLASGTNDGDDDYYDYDDHDDVDDDDDDDDDNDDVCVYIRLMKKLYQLINRNSIQGIGNI